MEKEAEVGSIIKIIYSSHAIRRDQYCEIIGGQPGRWRLKYLDPPVHGARANFMYNRAIRDHERVNYRVVA